MTNEPFEAGGLYVHIPFCLTRCGYCDFNTYAGLDHLKDGYVAALMTEAAMHADEWSGTPFVSVFLGGGTPTTLPVGRLRELLDRVRELYEVASGAEVTSEANPDTVDEAYLTALLDAGVTRLSLGVQSFDPLVLTSLERVHAPASARTALVAARSAGFTDVNLDLIYGAQGEYLSSWRRTLEEAVSLCPEHLSCYALTVEPATRLGRRVASGQVPPPDPDVQADLYALACEVLGQAGYRHYEVSNWARPGHKCVHNVGYWDGRPYLGLGAGAHSFRDGRRWWNVRPPTQYVAMAGRGDPPVGGEERLTDHDRRLERLLLGLRTTEGVSTEAIALDRALEFVEAGLVEQRGDRLSPTDRGMFLANDLVIDLV
jgi:oxygen-independent coproporphyrinogen-3 oxidase